MIEIPQAIQSLYPEAEFAGPANDGGFDDVRWHIKPDGITKAKVETELARLNVEYDSLEYARSRKAAYPSTGDQLDYIYHNGVAKWKTDMIDPVKTKYPKG